jgi:hypothetical protein
MPVGTFLRYATSLFQLQSTSSLKKLELLVNGCGLVEILLTVIIVRGDVVFVNCCCAHRVVNKKIKYDPPSQFF